MLPSRLFRDLRSLQYLHIDNLNWTKPIPADSFLGLASLKTLNLEGYGFTFDSGTFDYLEELESLYFPLNLKNCKTPEGLFSKLQKLKRLQISLAATDTYSCELTPQKGFFEGLRSLTSLSLVSSFNLNISLKTLPKKALKHMEKLRNLEIGIPVNYLENENFVDLPNLQSLYFYGWLHFQNPNSNPRALHGLANLKTLEIHTLNYFGEISQDFFGDLKSLKSLNLTLSSNSELSPNMFSALTALETLTISGANNAVTTLPNMLFAGLTSLRELTIQETKISTLSQFSLFGLSSLKYLGVKNNSKLTSLTGLVFQPLTALTYLNMNYNSIDFIDVEILRLPHFSPTIWQATFVGNRLSEKTKDNIRQVLQSRVQL